MEQPALSKPQAAFEESLIAVNLVSVASDKKRKRAPQLNIFALRLCIQQFNIIYFIASDKKRKRAPQLNIFALQRPYTPQFAWKGVTNEF